MNRGCLRRLRWSVRSSVRLPARSLAFHRLVYIPLRHFPTSLSIVALPVITAILKVNVPSRPIPVPHMLPPTALHHFPGHRLRMDPNNSYSGGVSLFRLHPSFICIIVCSAPGSGASFASYRAGDFSPALASLTAYM